MSTPLAKLWHEIYSNKKNNDLTESLIGTSSHQANDNTEIPLLFRSDADEKKLAADFREKLLASGDPEKQKELIRIAGERLRYGLNKENAEILRMELRQIIHGSSDRQLVRQAIFALTRSASRGEDFNMLIDDLHKALNKELIDANDYCGEIVHLSMTLSDHRIIENYIESEKNSYASIVLSNYLSDPGRAEALKKDGYNLDVIRRYLDNNVPTFSGAPFSISALEMIQFDEWATARANVTAVNDGEARINELAKYFDGPVNEPRMLISLLNGAYGVELYKEIVDKHPNSAGIAAVRQYISDYKHTSMIQQIEAHFIDRLKFN